MMNFVVSFFKKIAEQWSYFLLALSVCIFDFVLIGSLRIETVSFFLFLILLQKTSNFLFKIVFFGSVIITAFYLPMNFLYGRISLSMVAATFYTNTTEALGFFSLLPWWIYFAVILYLCFSIPLTFLNYKPISYKLSSFFLLFFILISFCRPIYLYATGDSSSFDLVKYVRYGPFGFSLRVSNYYTEVKTEEEYIKSALAEKDTWLIEEVNLKKDLQIVVIGESVRRDAMHCYGFSVENTPFASSSNLILFNNALASSYTTVPSLLRTLCENKIEAESSSYNMSNNIITLAKKAGLYTHWFSNQGYIGVHDSPIAAIGRMADDARFLQIADYSSDKSKKDADLLPWVKEAIAADQQDKKQLIVVHLVGSHSPFEDRTDGEYDVFVHNDAVSCYVQSIKNTDRLLKLIYDYAKESEKSFSMLYFSDHGLEFVKNTTLVHSENSKQSFQVPLLLWTDDLNERKTVEAYRSLSDFLMFFSQLSGIEAASLKNKYFFLSEEEGFDGSVLVNGGATTKKYISLSDNFLEFD